LEIIYRPKEYTLQELYDNNEKVVVWGAGDIAYIILNKQRPINYSRLFYRYR